MPGYGDGDGKGKSMTGLLISVRSGAEAGRALAGGAHVIDVKEPTRGSLGASSPAVWEEVRGVVAGRAPLSVALGELAEPRGAWDVSQLTGFTYAKVGLAGCGDWPDWRQRWGQRVRQFAPAVTPVAVVYADWRTARAPAPEAVLAGAIELRCGAVLVDTYAKGDGDLWTHYDESGLVRLVASIRRHGMLAVLGGSLGLASMSRVARTGADYVAVRGAACRGRRTGGLEQRRVRALADLLRRPAAGQRPPTATGRLT